MNTVTSSDGTRIAYSKNGSGPPLVLVDGAMCYREFGPARKFAEELSSSFTVYTYDRRGRGESGNTEPYDVQREVEDLAAVIKETGETPYVFGQSSGGGLVLAAAQARVPMRKLAVYEIPFIVDPSGPVGKDEAYHTKLTEALATGRNGDAVKLFMRLVGVPGPMVALFPIMPGWSKMKTVAPTLPNDHAILADGRYGKPLAEDRYAAVTAPGLAMAGGKSEEWFRNSMRNVAERLPEADYRTIDGQNHMLKASAIAPVLREFFA